MPSILNNYVFFLCKTKVIVSSNERRLSRTLGEFIKLFFLYSRCFRHEIDIKYFFCIRDVLDMKLILNICKYLPNASIVCVTYIL